jgi:hypothetical protein
MAIGRFVTDTPARWLAMRMDVELLGLSIPIGGTNRYDCMECHGKGTLVITRTAEKAWAYTCHRASCDIGGFIGDRKDRPLGTQPVLKEHARYVGDVLSLSPDYKFYFETRFGINLEDERKYWVQQNTEGQFVMPVRNPFGGLRGYGIRRGAWKDLDNMPKCPLPAVLPKFRSYLHEDKDPMLCWYTPSMAGDLWPVTGTVVLVEDQVSAMKCATRGCVGVALMGAELNHDKVREIQRYGGTGDVVIALDEDATNKALKMARKWGAGLRNCRVAILDKDLKDSESIMQALGLQVQEWRK